MTLRGGLIALFLLAVPAQADAYANLDDYLRKTSGFEPASEPARCYSDAVQRSMGNMTSMIKSVFTGSYSIPKPTQASMERMMQEDWRTHGAKTLADLVDLSCPGTVVDAATPIEDIHPLAKLPTR
jgi:hypothetical protein